MNNTQQIQEIAPKPFSTSDMETSSTLCGCTHEITKMYYDEGRPGFPWAASGYVISLDGGKNLVTWNKLGKCMAKGERIPEFDLVRPTNEPEKGSSYTALFFIALIVIAICKLF